MIKEVRDGVWKTSSLIEKYLANKVNEVFSLICSLNKGFRKNKPGISAGLSSFAPLLDNYLTKL